MATTEGNVFVCIMGSRLWEGHLFLFCLTYVLVVFVQMLNWKPFEIKKTKNSSNNWDFAFFCSPSQSLVMVYTMTDLEQGKVAQCLKRGLLTHICMLRAF